ncbi:hypothetical protein GCM10011506_00670 [Marivirga lumbricoides]|uniref:Ankyrin repeat domain-containing protein n=1 Tax=Marivirga lumbricoides TaxID=1046115 RepID=A0ABQ1L9Q8_9BACT|nr:hypothetical protein GCM10011506_00670 [Marivirga lumbricoides]
MLKKNLIILLILLTATLTYGQNDSLSNTYLKLTQIIEKQDLDALKKTIGDENVQSFEPADEMPLLFYACSVGDIDIVLFLISRGSNPNSISKYGTVANWAAEKKYLHVIEALLKNGFNPKIEEMSYWVNRYQEGEEILPEWMSRLVEALLEKKFSYEHLPYMEFTDPADPLILTAAIAFDTTKTFTLAKSLIAKGVDVDLVDKRGLTALHWAIKALNVEATSLLIKEGADVNKPMYSKRFAELFSNVIFDNNLTPLHLLFYLIDEKPQTMHDNRKEILKIIKILMKAGADPTIKTKHDPKTVYEIAEKLNDPKIMKLLNKY